MKIESKFPKGKVVGNHFTPGQLVLLDDLVAVTGNGKAAVIRKSMMFYADSLGVPYSDIEPMSKSQAGSISKRGKGEDR